MLSQLKFRLTCPELNLKILPPLDFIIYRVEKKLREISAILYLILTVLKSKIYPVDCKKKTSLWPCPISTSFHGNS